MIWGGISHFLDFYNHSVKRSILQRSRVSQDGVYKELRGLHGLSSSSTISPIFLVPSISNILSSTYCSSLTLPVFRMISTGFVALCAILSMLQGVHAGLNLGAKNNLAVYWGSLYCLLQPCKIWLFSGQNSYGQSSGDLTQHRLSYYCDSEGPLFTLYPRPY